MLVSMLVASDDATAGSVIRKAERISPSISGRSHFFLCSLEPYRMNTSMLPVSGAEQLNTSEAQPIWPISSASGAYSRLVNPAPWNSSASCAAGGMKWFHRPWAFALAFRPVLQLFVERDHPPALTLGVLLLVDRHGGANMLVHERLHAIEPFALTVRHIEIHGAFLTLFGQKLLTALSPRAPLTARLFIASGGAAETGRALTLPPSNHSFIQAFELQRSLYGPTDADGSHPSRDPDRRRTALCRARLRRRHAARHRRGGQRQSRGGELSFRLQGRIDRRIVRHPGSGDQPRAAQRVKAGGRRGRGPRRHRCHPARAGRSDAARLPRPRPRALARGAFHDPRLD